MSIGAVEALKDQDRPLPLEVWNCTLQFVHRVAKANVRSFVQAN